MPVQYQDVIKVYFSDEEMEIIHAMAGEAWFGGQSRIYDNRDERNAKGANDNLIGQMCECAGNMAVHGRMKGLEEYVRIREKKNADKYSGDDGSDIETDLIDARIDVKGSLMRRNPDPLSYNLPVRPRERHSDAIYILALVDKENPTLVHLVGWAHDSDLPPNPAQDGPLKGAYTIRAKNLEPLGDAFELEI